MAPPTTVAVGCWLVLRLGALAARAAPTEPQKPTTASATVVMTNSATLRRYIEPP
jgi:hypothetical protein